MRRSAHRVLRGALCVLASLAWIGSAASDLSAAAVGQAALRAKLSSLYPEVTRWDITPMPSSVDRDAPGRDTDLAAVVVRVGVRSTVWVGPRSDVQARRGALLWYAVAGYGSATVVTHRVEPGVDLQVSDGVIAQSDLLSAGCRPLSSPEELAGMRSRITLEPGKVICRGAVEKRPPVTRGEEVTVRYVGDAVSLSVRAVAQGDGALGKLVRVRSAESGEIFMATVSGDAEVSVQ